MPKPTEPWGDAEPGPTPGGAVARLTVTLAHDLANVLTAITGNLALAERHAAGNPRLIRLLGNIQAAADRGLGLAQDLLALSPGAVVEGGFFAGWGEPSASGRILIVEDDPQVAEVAMAILEDMGHKVDHRLNAAAALDVLRDGSQFDLVFSDIVMPGGMSGIELAEMIAETYPMLPVLLATGYSSAALATNALRFPVLAKPYSVQELSRRVAQMLPQQATGKLAPPATS